MTPTLVAPAVLEHAVSIACRAPSLHNSQPWSWVLDGAVLQLHLDRSRVVAHTDPSARQALISCGAVLDHLAVAVRAAGWRAVVDRFPNPNDLDHLASVEFRRGTHVTDADRLRANAILRRRTDRLPFLPPLGWDLLGPVLAGLISDEVRLDVIPDALRPELAEASRLTEAVRRYDADYHAELDWWTASFEYDSGIPRSALTSVSEADRVAVNRVFPAGGHGERRAALNEDHAMVLALSTPDDGRADALASGRALSSVLLEATAAGLATCTVTHVTETELGRAVVAELSGTTGVPQVLIRLGQVPPLDQVPVLTPRRALSDILRRTS